MEARAARASDVADVVNLMGRCGFPAATEVEELVAGLFRGERSGERQRLWVEDVIAASCPPAPDGETGPTR